MSRRPWTLPLGFVLVLALLAGACGYRFADSGAGLPDDVRTIYIQPFLNRTRAVGLEDGLAFAVRRVLARRESPGVVERFEDADAVLSGVIRHYGITAVGVNRSDEVLELEARLDVETTLRRRQSREVLWPRRVVRLREVYPAARGAVVPTSSGFHRNTLNVEDVRRLTDARLAEDSRTAARKRLLEEFARMVRERMAEGF